MLWTTGQNQLIDFEMRSRQRQNMFDLTSFKIGFEKQIRNCRNVPFFPHIKIQFGACATFEGQSVANTFPISQFQVSYLIFFSHFTTKINITLKLRPCYFWPAPFTAMFIIKEIPLNGYFMSSRFVFDSGEPK